MRLTPFYRAVLLIAGGGVAIGALWWKCARDPAINFLPADSRADWIVFPAPVEAGAHRIATIDTAFQREFQLASPPKTAQVQLRAARRTDLRINGKRVEIRDTGNWKDVTSIDVAGFLQSGPNKIEARVFNDDAPAALWFRMATDDAEMRSDSNWEASLAGSAWRSCVLAIVARHPGLGNLIGGGERAIDVLPRIWIAWILYGILGVLLAMSVTRWLRPGDNTADFTRGQIALVLGICVAAWAILFWNNAQRLPFHCGYDSKDHLDYIRYIQEHRALPLPTEGFETFQAPLYYATSAALLSIFHLSTNSQGAVAALRALTTAFGVANFIFVFLSIRLLFPRQRIVQLIGLLTAAFLPMQLYLSHYVTNESLAGALASVTIYVGLRLLKKQEPAIWEYAALGICAGAALLSKATSLLLVPPLFGALLIKMLHEKTTLSRAILDLAAASLTMIASCVWYYAWIWHHFGKPIVGNWERELGFNWWQDPGYHVARDYFRFGRALIAPLFSGFNGFGDGIYSTLWGDALCGGFSGIFARTPWNYNLLVGNYPWAILPTLIIIIGTIRVVRWLVRRPTPEWFLLLGFSAAIAVGLIFMTLRVPSYAQVKAFYGLSAIVPICAFAAAGWQYLLSRKSKAGSAITAFLIFWALTSFGSVWIRNSPWQHMYSATRLIASHEPDRALKEATAAVEAEPKNANARWLVGGILDEMGDLDKAADAAQAGIQLDPTNGDCHFLLAVTLGKRQMFEDALREAKEAVNLEPENVRAHDLVFTLTRQFHRDEEVLALGRTALATSPFNSDLHYRVGLAAAERGDFKTAAQHFGYALLLAPNQTGIRDKLHLAIRFASQALDAPAQLQAISSIAPDSPDLLNELAWIFATNPNSALRNGSEAVRLSERANVLTHRARPKFLVTLAAAYSESGRFSDGVSAAQQAVSLAKMEGDNSTSTVAEKLLDALHHQQPYREEPAL
jgi:tetratricopeptide (TPR) repeat protein